ncbi:MAG: hypothetical protein Q8N53_08455 [Longimicrobiales bacterium]|nr:hypothetical protein [Longimicrobiales bacterium]
MSDRRSFVAVALAAGVLPALPKASWDWGFGDWESPLGAAAHTGQREIARYLLTMGARPTLFSAAMLGQLNVVRSFIEAQPGSQAIRGPHGINLMRHALAGRYAYGPAEGDALVVEAENGSLSVRHGGEARRGLTHLGEGVFHPAGAPSVRIRLGPDGTMTVAFGGATVAATRS